MFGRVRCVMVGVYCGLLFGVGCCRCLLIVVCGFLLFVV